MSQRGSEGRQRWGDSPHRKPAHRRRRQHGSGGERGGRSRRGRCQCQAEGRLPLGWLLGLPMCHLPERSLPSSRLRLPPSPTASLGDPGRHSPSFLHSPGGREGMSTVPRNLGAKPPCGSASPWSPGHTFPAQVLLPVVWMRRLRLREAHLPACQWQSAWNRAWAHSRCSISVSYVCCCFKAQIPLPPFELSPCFPGQTLALAPRERASSKTHRGTSQRGERPMVGSSCPKPSLPVRSQSRLQRGLGIGPQGRREDGAVFWPDSKMHISQDSLGLRRLLGPGQDLWYRGTSQGSGGRPVSLRLALIEV